MYSEINREIKQEYYQQNFSNDGQRFVAWYLRNVHVRDMNETKDDVTDGTDDKQIDAVVIDDEKSTIFIVQGKFYGCESVDAAPLREVLSAWLHLFDLERLQEAGNDKLKRKMSEVARALEDDYEVEFELITTSALTPIAIDDLATFQQQLAELSETKDLACSISVIDRDELRRRYDLALERDNPTINHTVDLSACSHMQMTLDSTEAVIAAIPLSECIRFPGIKDGTLFQKNVRQSLGLSNRVNKGIKSTIYSDRPMDFFFFHNGITAICNKISMEGSRLTLAGLSVVNGCQSLNTILSCSERVKQLTETCVLFRFYEIPQRERGDRISINTNSQSSVKPRDLRSNDRRVLSLKRRFEQKFPNGCFLTKRGEMAAASCDKDFVLDLSDLGKYLIAWHSQRPNISYSETRIFDKYFEQLFRRDYSPENAQALHNWMRHIRDCWTKDNPLGLNESLLAMRAYAPYHHLYAVSLCFCVANTMPEVVPTPHLTYKTASSHGLVRQVVDIAGTCLNSALEAAADEPLPQNRVFSPQNWVKAKSCLAGIRAAMRQYFNMLPAMPNGRETSQKLKSGLALTSDQFEDRWAAD